MPRRAVSWCRSSEADLFNEMDLTDQIYEAALLPDLWPAVLDSLAEVAGAVGTILLASDMNDLRFINSSSLAGFVTDFVAGDWGKANTRLPRLLAAQHAGFIREDDVYTAAEIETDVMIREFLRPRGFGWATATAFPVPTGDTLIFSIERRFADGPVPREAIRALDRLRPHLGRASLLSARFKLERARAAVAALGRIGLPAAVLAHRGRLVAANDRLDALIPRVVQDRRERVTLWSPGADALLASALRVSGTVAARSIPIPARDEDPAMVAHLIPVRGLAQDIFSGGATLLVLTPVLASGVAGAELLEALFDLTPAEARVARAIALGETVSTFASARGVTLDTVRSQLKSTFAKTGVSRQGDLIRLICGLNLTGQRTPIEPAG